MYPFGRKVLECAWEQFDLNGGRIGEGRGALVFKVERLRGSRQTFGISRRGRSRADNI
jgi:hypothetical protein